ncbi:adenosine deaminase [Candidatus Fermentibacteria bacterium]|nr:adenosine deaminase [Candidatus Fermentibacteria bacterium]
MTAESLPFREFPKVLLHDHLDGGLRPSTIVELAKAVGYDRLPTDDPSELAVWFHRGANQKSLPVYLEGFAHTCALMQTKENLSRVAYEMIEDMKAENVVYVETRFAPVFHMNGGLSMEEVVRAVLDGLNAGSRDFGVDFGLIICSLRHMKDSLRIAQLAVAFRDQGVVGFDLAGEEGGYPAKRHVEAFHLIQQENFNSTIHAGEGFGKDSIWQAIQLCGAHRIGHGVRLIEDMMVEEGRVTQVGRLAQYVLDKRIPLEICISSNLHTGAVRSIQAHPFRLFYVYGFRVTLNTDNRLMSGTTLTDELELAHREFGMGFNDFEKLTINAMKSAFIHHEDRLRIIYEVIKPGYARLRRTSLEGRLSPMGTDY